MTRMRRPIRIAWLAMDSAGRLFVADRSNSRIQIFDQDGKFLAEWKQFGRPSGVFINKDDIIYVADLTSHDTTNPGYKQGIWIGSPKQGKVTAFIPWSFAGRFPQRDHAPPARRQPVSHRRD